ncbi:TPA: polysaccharide pyruvyl transferase family protein [Streptococcus suis]
MKKKIFFIYIFLKTVIYKLLHKNKLLFILGTPMHGNLGDSAIALAEDIIIKENLKKVYVEIPSNYVVEYLTVWKKLIGRNDIFIHGGGFTGTIWPEEMEMLLNVLTTFNRNKIIILPQTIFFENSNSIQQEQLKVAIEQCNNLTILVREKFSKLFIENNFKDAHSILVPDVVTYLNKSYFNFNDCDTSNSVLFVMRRDKEGLDHQVAIEKIKDSINDFSIQTTDTVVQYAVRPWNRLKEVEKKLRQFRSSRLVITDRLHGMVFSAIAEVPCIVLNNNNYKIKGVYDWLKDQSNIQFVEDLDFLQDIIQKLLEISNEEFKNQDLRNELSTVIQKLDNNRKN